MKSEMAKNAVNGEFLPKKIVEIIDKKSYIKLPFDVANHILCNSKLLEAERLFYILVTLYSIRSEKGRYTETAGSIWETRINLKSAYMYQLLKSLEEKEYMKVVRGKTNQRNDTNIITPTLPNSIFENIYGQPISSFKSEKEAMNKLDNKSLYVPINITLAKTLLKDKEIPSFSKLLWIFLYIEGYKHKTKKNLETLMVYKTQKELAATLNVSTSKISRAINKLNESGYINSINKRIRDKSTQSNRKDKSIWEIHISFPEAKINMLESLSDRKTKTDISSGSHKKANRSDDVAPNQHNNNKNNSLLENFGSKNNPCHNQNKSENDSPLKNVFLDNNERAKARELLEKHVIEIKTLSKTITVDDKLRESLTNKLSAEDRELITKYAKELISNTTEMSDSELQKFKQSLQQYDTLLLEDYWAHKEILFSLKDLNLIVQMHCKHNIEEQEENNKPDDIENNVNIAKEVYEKDKKSFSKGNINHIMLYVNKLFANKDIHDKYIVIGTLRISMEVTNFIKNWKTRKDFKTEKDEVRFKLTVAGNLLREGQWNIPQDYIDADRKQVDVNLQHERSRFGLDEESNISGEEKFRKHG